MNSFRWSPFQDMIRVQSRLNRLFDNAGHMLKGWPVDSEGTRTWMPPADIWETENALVVNADVPGADPARIEVRVEDGVLFIRGARRFDEEAKPESFLRAERVLGPFARSFTLSTRVDAEKVAAKYKDGVLRISLPKSEQAKPKPIHISAVA